MIKIEPMAIQGVPDYAPAELLSNKLIIFVIKVRT